MLCDLMNCRTPGLPVPHHLLKFAQVHVHCIGDAIQPSHLLMPSSPSALNLSQHQGLFQWVSCSHQMTKILEPKYQKTTYEPWSLDLSKMRTCIPSVLGVSEIAACPPSPVADGPSALPSAHPSALPPPLPPAVSNPSCLFTWCQSLYASCCTALLYFAGYCTVRLKLFSLFFNVCFYVLFVWKIS